MCQHQQSSLNNYENDQIEYFTKEQRHTKRKRVENLIYMNFGIAIITAIIK